MVDLIVVAILLVLVGSAVIYIVKEKKKGTKCIGCPVEGGCGGNGKNCSCHADTK